MKRMHVFKLLGCIISSTFFWSNTRNIKLEYYWLHLEKIEENDGTYNKCFQARTKIRIHKKKKKALTKQ